MRDTMCCWFALRKTYSWIILPEPSLQTTTQIAILQFIMIPQQQTKGFSILGFRTSIVTEKCIRFAIRGKAVKLWEKPSLQEKEKELLQPIIDRAKQAIAEVAKENGYTYIFDTSAGTLLYQQDSDDILALVKKKLGLK